MSTFRKRLGVFLFIFLVKLVQGYYLSYLTKCSNPEISLGKIALASGDTNSYIEPIENFIANGDYFSNNGRELVYAGRMPYYGVYYFPFRVILGKDFAFDALVVFQIIVDSFSIFLTFIFIIKLFDQTLASLFFIIILIATHVSHFDIYVSPESLTSSFLLLTLIFWLNHTLEGKGILILSLVIGLLVCLKPYYVVLYPIVLLLSLDFKLLKRSLGIIFIEGIWYCGILILLLAPWTVRNFLKFKEFIPFQQNITASYYYSEADLACREFIIAWGGNFVFWEKTAAGCYFYPNKDLPCIFTFPDRALTSGYNLQDIERARNLLIQSHNNPSEENITKATIELKKLTHTYRKDRPINYFFLSRLYLVKEFIVHSGSYYLPIHNSNPCFSTLQYIIKITQSLVYWLAFESFPRNSSDYK